MGMGPEIIKLTSLNEFHVTGRGKVFTLSCKANGLSVKRTEVKKLVGQQVEVNGIQYLVKGVECLSGLIDDEVMDSVAIQVI